VESQAPILPAIPFLQSHLHQPASGVCSDMIETFFPYQRVSPNRAEHRRQFRECAVVAIAAPLSWLRPWLEVGLYAYVVTNIFVGIEGLMNSLLRGSLLMDHTRFLSQLSLRWRVCVGRL